MESSWLNVLEKDRHTLYSDSVTLIQGHFFSVLAMFLISKMVLLLLLLTDNGAGREREGWKEEEEVES